MSEISTLIGRAVAVLYPEIAENLLSKVAPITNDKKHIPEIWNYIKNIYPELDSTDKNTLFIAVIYRIYAPAVLVGRHVSKLPAGVRTIVSSLIEQRNPEMVNFFLEYSKVNLKNPRYYKKVHAIIDAVVLDCSH